MPERKGAKTDFGAEKRLESLAWIADFERRGVIFLELPERGLCERGVRVTVSGQRPQSDEHGSDP